MQGRFFCSNRPKRPFFCPETGVLRGSCLPISKQGGLLKLLILFRLYEKLPVKNGDFERGVGKSSPEMGSGPTETDGMEVGHAVIMLCLGVFFCKKRVRGCVRGLLVEADRGALCWRRRQLNWVAGRYKSHPCWELAGMFITNAPRFVFLPSICKRVKKCVR